MKYGAHPGTGRADGGGIIERRADQTDAALGKIGCRVAGEDDDGAAGREQAADEMAAKEARAAGDKNGGAGMVV